MPLFTCAPLKIVLPPVSHSSLGLWNDGHAKFNNHVLKRIKKKLKAKIEVQNVCLLTEIDFDDVLVEFDNKKNELSKIVDRKANFN